MFVFISVLALAFTVSVAFATTTMATMTLRVPATVAATGSFLFAFLVFGSIAQACGQRQLFNLLAQEVLDTLEAVHVIVAHKGDSLAIAIGTGCTTDTVYVVTS